MADEQLSIVIIEWDGGRPPSTWYNRLYKLGYKVRGNKDESPLSRRRNSRHETAGVVAQEGTLICSSQSEARALGMLARDMGAKDVMVGYMDVTQFEMTNDDALALSRIQSVLGKRGKPEADRIWTITCQDEMRSYRHEGRTPVNCPHCGSFHISTREGEPMVICDDGAALIDFWTRSRFITGTFEAPQISQDGTAATGEAVGKADLKAIEGLRGSKLMDQIESLAAKDVITRDQALHLLDLGIANLEATPTERQAARMAGMMAYMERGGDVKGLALAVEAGQVDLIDLIRADRSALVFALKA